MSDIPENDQSNGRKGKGRRRGRGEGSITHRSDGLWMGRISLGLVGGRRRRKTVYGESKTVVLQKLRKLQAEHATGRFVYPQDMTVEKHLTGWVESVAKARVAPATHDRYKLVIDKNLIPNIGLLKLSKLTTHHVNYLYHAMAKDGKTTQAQQMAGTVLHTAMRDAVRQGLIHFNPVVNSFRPKATRREMQVWDAGQVRAFLDAASEDRLYAMFVLALDTGARLGELMGLQWGDVDLQAGTVSINRSLEEIRGRHRLKEPKTKNARRQLALSRFALDVLGGHRQAMLAAGHIRGQVFCDSKCGFLRKSNVTRQNFARCIRRANEKAVKEAAEKDTEPALLSEIRFHDLRHTAATLLLQAGVNIKVVSERLGHERVQITLDTYSHVLPGVQEIPAGAMQKIFRPEILAG